MDWERLRERVRSVGMRNSNCAWPSRPPPPSPTSRRQPVGRAAYQNLFVKANLSGDFTVINMFLVAT
jgi:ribonucleoside-diphosphate reductase alpha chain